MSAPPERALAGRSALVTGASRGIGAATARALAARGARLVLVARNGVALHALATELAAELATESGRRTIVAPCDLLDAAAVERMADHARTELGDAPDIIVSDAGIFELAPLDTMSVDLFTRTVQTNLLAPFALLHAFLPRMRERGTGHFITVGSIADRVVYPENGAYSAAKFGGRALHQVLRAETQGTGVRATLVSPGPTDTPLWDPVLARPAGRVLPTRAVMLDAASVADAVVYAATRPTDVNVDELRLSHA